MLLLTKVSSAISLKFVKGTLSDKKIRKLLGVHIFIYPFENKNLQAASYDLTASKCAFIVEDDEQKLIVKDDYIIIPQHKTAIIETNESIYVSKYIAGTYHSLVGLTNRGIGDIGTTLDPNYFGVSVISLHNTTDKDIKIRVGEAIASIVFSVTNGKSTGMSSTLCNHIRYNLNVEDPKFYYDIYDKKEMFMIYNCSKENYVDLKENFNRYINKFKLIDKNTINDCPKCQVCEKNEECKIKILKNFRDLDEKQNEIFEDIKLWSEEDYRANLECLKNKVRKYVIKRDLEKDVLLISFIVFIIGVIMDGLISIFILENNSELTLVLAGVTLTIISIISGIIINYKLKNQK